jgi:nucleoside-diphosphate-sugar epimerase
MAQIDKTKPVLVTGATGYVAGWLVKRLLDEGLTVHAAVRNPDDKKKTSHLDELAANSKGQIKYFKSDLLTPGSYKEAMEGCELVYHTASPFNYSIKDPQKELIEPALNGTKNVLESANEVSSVKRVVVTSSCAAIFCDASDLKEKNKDAFTEDDWNTKADLNYQPYSYSKTLAEKKAWEMMEAQNRWDLVTINPSFVLGPPLNPNATTSGTFEVLVQMGDGTFKSGAPRLGIGMVDVRDVAEAHFQAGFNPNAQGRYITSAHNTDIFEITQTLIPKYGDKLPLPKKPVPKWLLMLIGPFVNKEFTRRYIRNNINVPWKADNSKIKKELGIQFRPMKETVVESMDKLVEEGIFS